MYLRVASTTSCVSEIRKNGHLVIPRYHFRPDDVGTFDIEGERKEISLPEGRYIYIYFVHSPFRVPGFSPFFYGVNIACSLFVLKKICYEIRKNKNSCELASNRNKNIAIGENRMSKVNGSSE